MKGSINGKKMLKVLVQLVVLIHEWMVLNGFKWLTNSIKQIQHIAAIGPSGPLMVPMFIAKKCTNT